MHTSDFSATLKHYPKKIVKCIEIRRTVKNLLLLAVLDNRFISPVKLVVFYGELVGLFLKI